MPWQSIGTGRGQVWELVGYSGRAFSAGSVKTVYRVESRPVTALHVVVKNVRVAFEVGGANGSRVVWITDVQTDSIQYTQSGNI